MNRINLFLILFLILEHLQAQTTYNLKWDIQNLPFEVKTAEGPRSLKRRLSETGSFSEKLDLPIKKQMHDGKILLKKTETAYIYLFIKNKTDQRINFSVAPHSTHPGASALGFHFGCLCNGHIYTVEPHAIWYRIMSLKNESNSSEKEIELSHSIFKVEKK